MNNIYEQKAKKYKYKYLELKKKIEYISEGGGVFKRIIGLENSNQKNDAKWKIFKSKDQIDRENKIKQDALSQIKKRYMCINNNEECDKCFALWNTDKDYKESFNILFDRRKNYQEYVINELSKVDLKYLNSTLSENEIKYIKKKIPDYSFEDFVSAKCPSLADTKKEVAEQERIKQEQERMEQEYEQREEREREEREREERERELEKEKIF
jgi:hypothetical protein